MNTKRLEDYFLVVKVSPIYKDYYKGINSIYDAEPLRKHTLRTLLKNNFNLQNQSKGVYLIRSGGTTNTPLIFPVDIKENLHQRQLLAEALIKYGMFSPKTIALNLFGYSSMYRSASILDDILERCYATTISASAKSSSEFIYKAVQNFKPNSIIGTPSVIALFAKYVLDNNLKVKINHLMFAGEFLLPSQAESFKNAFGVERIYSLYGAAESGIWGWSTYTNNTTSFEVLDDVIIEIINPDKNGNGLIAVTNLLRKRIPLFRYLTGDVGKLTYQGKRQILTLKSRVSKSFAIQADSYFLKDFDKLLEIVDRFQIQLSLNSVAQTELKFLVLKSNISVLESKIIETTVEKKLLKILSMNPNFLKLEVKHVSESEFYTNPDSSKTPSIVDFRN